MEKAKERHLKYGEPLPSWMVERTELEKAEFRCKLAQEEYDNLLAKQEAASSEDNKERLEQELRGVIKELLEETNPTDALIIVCKILGELEEVGES